MYVKSATWSITPLFQVRRGEGREGGKVGEEWRGREGLGGGEKERRRVAKEKLYVTGTTWSVYTI